MTAPNVRFKRSSVPGKIPNETQVPLGEIALNTYDGRVFASKNVGIGTTVFVVNPWNVGAGTDSYDINFSAGNVGIKTTNTQNYELYVEGDANISGIVSATSFYGNGYSLTDLVNTINITKIEGINLQEESVSIGSTFTTINFVGPDVTVTGSGSTATVTLSVPINLNKDQDYGSINSILDPVTSSLDFSTITSTVTSSFDFGGLVLSGAIYPSEFLLPSYTVNTLPSATPAGKMLFVTDETGGSVPAFSDGTNWRRVTDRQIVS